MKNIEVTTHLAIYEALDELPQEVRHLMEKAFAARDNAYAPYSHFQVGAAILMQDGEIITGSNQENASYPSGLCAERTAIYYTGAKYPHGLIKSMAISAKSLKKKTTKAVPPCGACRQAIAEYEVKQKTPIVLYFMGDSGEIFKSESLENLLPLLFTHDYL